jgi:hypothetical protein
MGISQHLRDNPETVPARDDQPAILDLVVLQVRRLETRVEQVLKARDLTARSNMRDGLSDPQDPESRRHRSNESRAHKRMVWATDTFRALRGGVAPATIIDPMTGQPLQAETAPPTPSAPPPPTAAGPPPEAANRPPADVPAGDPADIDLGPEDPIRVPENLPLEDKESLWLMGAMLRPLLRAGLVKLPPLPGGSAADTDKPPPQS